METQFSRHSFRVKRMRNICVHCARARMKHSAMMALRILVSLLLIGVAFSTPLTLYKNPEVSEPSVQKVVCPNK